MLLGQKILIGSFGVLGAATSSYFGLSELFKHKTFRDKFLSQSRELLPNDEGNKTIWKERVNRYSGAETENKIEGLDFSGLSDDDAKVNALHDKCSKLLDSSLNTEHSDKYEKWINKWCLKDSQ